MRRGIERLKHRVAALKRLDPQSISTRRSSEIVSHEVAIEETLVAVFGPGTPKFLRYAPAATLEPSPIVTPVWIGPGGEHSGGEDLSYLQNGIADRKRQAIARLEQAVRGLEEEIGDQEAVQNAHEAPPRPALSRNKVFVVHGHDVAAREAMARFLEKIELEAIILHEKPDQGLTIIEKFETYASQVGFAVVLLTPDDLGGPASASAQAARARQNVIFELGYFVGKLGRGRACLLRKGEVEIPSDLYGVIYTDMDAADGWKLKLVRELKAADLQFDANKAWA
jgi:predicted nucleotide-binding protein